MKSGSRNKAEGTVDKIAGRVMEAFSKLTGNVRPARGQGGAGPGCYAEDKGPREAREVTPDRRPARSLWTAAFTPAE